LVKYSNVGVLLALLVAIVLRARARRGIAAEIALLLLCAAIPTGAWMLRCQLVLGDWSAAKDKVQLLGWTTLTLRQSLAHPIFTPLGALDFTSELCVTFWRGDLVWGDRVQRVDWTDKFYLAVT